MQLPAVCYQQAITVKQWMLQTTRMNTAQTLVMLTVPSFQFLDSTIIDCKC